MRILVTGDRNWTDAPFIKRALIEVTRDPSLEPHVVAHGAARGADSLAEQIAWELNFQAFAYPANWKKYGRSAGSIRNRAMFNDFLPDLVLAFHDHIDESKGTKDMIQYAKSKGCKVVLYSHDKLTPMQLYAAVDEFLGRV